LKSRRSNLPRKESRRFITFGFGVILSLSLIVGLFSYSRLTFLKAEIDSIANEHHVKTLLINHMHKIVSERSLTVHNIMHSVTEDPFRADEEFMHYNKLATAFVLTREHYSDFPLRQEESQLFQDTLQIIRESQPLQDQLISNVMDGLSGNNTQAMFDKDRKNEQQLYNNFNALLSSENELSLQAHTSASDAYNEALLLLIIFSIVTLVVSLIVAQYVIRRVTRTEKALFEEKKQAEITLHAMGDAVVTTDLSGKILYSNPIAELIIGKSHEEIRGQEFCSVVHILDRNKTPVTFQLEDKLAARNISLADSTIINLQNQEEIPIEGTTSLLHDENSQIIGRINIFRDLSENRNLTDLVAWQATHDTLTGLMNRNQFEQLLSHKLEDAKTNKREHAFLYADLDQFKVINDTCGHTAGDNLLQQVTKTLLTKVRLGDTVSRLGGDEFGLLLDSCSIDTAQRIAEEILQDIQAFRFDWEGVSFKIGASIGVLEINEESVSVAKLMSDADAACYIAKEKGRNCAWIHHSNDKEVAHRRDEMVLTTQINQALEKHRFSMYKQKIMSIKGATQNNLYELLLRMEDENGDEISPTVFIPAAERYSMMPEIDKWVIKTVFTLLALQKNNALEPEIACINLSGQSLSQEKFLDFVEQEISNTNVDPEKICFEITETAAIENLQSVTNFISVLRKKGCKFALDDFGSGMSSFTYLRNFTVDYIKIDGEFVKNINSDNINREMVKAMHNLGQVMNIKTIAEYVESDAVLDELANIGIDFVQGYSIHLPEPVE